MWVLEELINDVSHMSWFRQAIKDEEAHGLDEKIDSAMTLFDRLGNSNFWWLYCSNKSLF